MRRILLPVLATALLIPAFARPSAAIDAKSQLVTAAAAAEVPIYTEELMVLTHGANTFAAAPIQGFENVPAAGFAEGADMAFAYIDFPGSAIPSGNYTLRGKAPASSIGLGEYAGTIEIVNADGDVVATLAANINTVSTTVPNPLPYPRTVITGALETAADSPAAAGAKVISSRPAGHEAGPRKITGRLYVRDSRGWLVHIVFIRFECPNGSTIEGFFQIP